MIKRSLYFLSSALRYFSRRDCPYCGSRATQIIDRKFVVTRLLLCPECRLQFRHPHARRFSSVYYNLFYKQHGITTGLPTDSTLAELKKNHFSGTGRNIHLINQLFTGLGFSPDGKFLLDYGCSWGYMTWQFAQCGMQVQGYEIAKNRAAFGQAKLHIPIVSSAGDIGSDFDIIFSSHVIEHLSDIREFTDLTLPKLKPGGYLIILCPNGSSDFRTKSPMGFHRFWGEVHPNLISDMFFEYVFRNYPCYISSAPYSLQSVSNWDQKSHHRAMNGGDELLCIVRKP
ncbi:MAG: methyltransferase domain-containing protein [Mucilaginibacter polytrichastri]|nr:methyltransferase domain-containing protein [Mucilaginibacter polytrichastri]